MYSWTVLPDTSVGAGGVLFGAKEFIQLDNPKAA
jgi:hypothetical protein